MKPSHLRLLTAGALALAFMLAAYNVLLVVSIYRIDPYHNDLIFDYAAAKIGLSSGWSHIYDLDLQKAWFEALTPGLTVGVLARYISPPPLAWLVAPFTILPFKVAYTVWLGIEAAALAVCWHLAAPGPAKNTWSRAGQLGVALALVPVAYEIQLVQPALLVAAAAALAYRLLRADRQLAAGAVLGLLVIKPQVALLLPPALLLAGYRRAFLGWLAVSAVLGIAILASLRTQGLLTYLSLVSYAGQVSYNHQLVIAYLVGPAPAALVLEVVLGGLALVAAWRYRGRPELAIAAGLLASIVASPYLHLGDLVILLVAGWLYLRAQPPLVGRLWLLFGAFAAELAALASPLPLFAFELGFLALMLAPAGVDVLLLRPFRAPTGPLPTSFRESTVGRTPAPPPRP